MSFRLRTFDFLNFANLERQIQINLHLINNSYNSTFFKLKKLSQAMKSKDNLYKFNLEHLIRTSQNIFLIDGFANRITPAICPHYLSKIRFCVGDLDSVYIESARTCSKLNIPLIYYENQDKTDLEKSLELSVLLRSENLDTDWFRSNDIELIDPFLDFSGKNLRLKDTLSIAAGKKFLDEEEWTAQITNIHRTIQKQKPTQTVIYDYMGNRSDHVM